MFRLTPVVKNLLIVNIVVLALDSLLLRGMLSNQFALYYVFSDFFQPYQFVTYMFLHGGIGHLFGNMLALFFFGPWLEQTWGPRRFFIFYMVTGVGAGLLYGAVQLIEMQMLFADLNEFISNPDPELFYAFIDNNFSFYLDRYYNFYNAFSESPTSSDLINKAEIYLTQLYELKANVPMVGASGAVFGILLAFGMLFPNAEIFLLFPPHSNKGKIFGHLLRSL